MYCEKCRRIVQDDRCPACGSRKVREPRPDDLCLLTEQDYLSSGILEDLLKQNRIPFLVKNVMGAGLAIKVGPMLDRSRFYVACSQLENAQAVMEELFSPEQAGEVSSEQSESAQTGKEEDHVL